MYIFYGSSFSKIFFINVETQAQRQLKYFIRKLFPFPHCVQTALLGKQRWYILHIFKFTWRSSQQCYQRLSCGFIQCGKEYLRNFCLKLGTLFLVNKSHDWQTGRGAYSSSYAGDWTAIYRGGGGTWNLRWEVRSAILTIWGSVRFWRGICFMRITGFPFQPTGNSAFQHYFLKHATLRKTYPINTWLRVFK